MTVIFNDGTLGVKSATPAAQFEWNWAANVLTVYSIGNPTAYYTSIEAGDYYNAFEVLAANCAISNIEARGSNNDILYVGVDIAGTVWNNVRASYTSKSTGDCLTSHGTSTVTTNGATLSYCFRGITDTGTTNTTHNDVAISNCARGVNSDTGTHVYNGTTITNCGTGLRLEGSGTQTFNNLSVSESSVSAFPGATEAGHGIFINNASGNVMVNYSIVSGNGVYGIYQQAGNLTINNGVVYKNSSQNIVQGASSGTLTMKNTTSWGTSGQRAFYKYTGTDGSHSIYVGDHNRFHQDGIGTFITFNGVAYAEANFANYKTAASPQDANSTVGDPLFVDAAGNNFRLQSSSPCRDQGADVGLTSDYLGTVVPQGALPDIGAYEYDATDPTLSGGSSIGTTSDSTPNFSFTTDEAGTITYSGDCSSATSSATAGANTITFSSLSDGSHSNCSLTVTDPAGNESLSLNVAAFTVDTAAPAPSSDSPNTTTAPQTASSSEYVPILAVGNKKTYTLTPGTTISVKSKYVVFRGKLSHLDNGRVEAYQDGTFKKQSKVKKSKRWRIRVNEKSRSATHTYQFKYYDSNNQLIETSQVFTVMIDRQKPKFTHLPKRISASPGETISWQVSDNDRIDHYQYTFRGRKVSTTDNFFTLPASLPNGSSKLTVRAYDRAGNFAVRRARITIR